MKNADNLIADDVFQQNASSSSGSASAAGTGAVHAAALLSAIDNSEEEDEEEEKYSNERSLGGRSGFVQTKIADISISVPVPGANKRR